MANATPRPRPASAPRSRTAEDYSALDFSAPKRECDLIMKGGITSGVVYPFAIAELAKAYRFRSIGGTSAGAIAAVFTAAAEYDRRNPRGGQEFVRLCHVASELGENLKGLFQPSPRLAPLFNLLMTAVGDRAGRIGTGPAILLALPGQFPLRTAVGLLIVLLSVYLAIDLGSVWLGLFGLLLGVVVTTALVAWALYRLVAVELPRHDFGICPGKTMAGSRTLAFSDWIADQIDIIAGNVDQYGNPGAPLTVGQLRGDDPDREIRVATMTTDLSSGRPYQLPLKSGIHYFSKREFDALFPPRLVAWLCEKGEPFEGKACDDAIPGDLRTLPVGDDFPVFLVARMSLSFPGLIRGIPLYRRDTTRACGDHVPMRRCLFSDGGISSNFPIHFFDAMLPRRPTFGIALGSLDPEQPDNRIDLPTSGRASTDLPVAGIGSVGTLLFAILNTAKDWQDTLQSLLPGYAERIVTVRLDDKTEGGLNLDMDRALIDELAEYGARAGERLRDTFSFSQHRYDRAITMLSAIEDGLDGMGQAYAHVPKGEATDWQRYDAILETFDTANYPNDPAWRKDPLHRLARDLAGIGDRAHQQHTAIPDASIRGGNLPPRDYRFRLVAVADLAPTEDDIARSAGPDPAPGAPIV